MADKTRRHVYSCPECGRVPRPSEDKLTRSCCIGSASGENLDDAQVQWNRHAWDHMIEATRDWLREVGAPRDGKIYG